MSDQNKLEGLHPDTLAVRSGTMRSQFNEHSEAMFLTSSFVYENSQVAADRFANAETGFIYSRFTNPSVSMFQDRLAALEGAQACIATASGMAAIFALSLTVLKAGDHIICSRAVFGSTIQMFSNILSKFEITTTYVDPTSVEEFSAAMRPNTRMVYIESPSNPLTEIADIRAISAICKAANALFVVDNCFCTPVLQKPLELGADVIIHSATKFLDGQGRVLGGAVLGSKELISKIFGFNRITGPTLSAFNAWVLLKGLETLSLRVEKQSDNALEIASWLESCEMVERVYHPQLPSHPQHELAMRQQSKGGAIVSFVVKGGRENAWKVIDSTKLCSITANLGDTRTTITHPATTTHGRMPVADREKAGLVEGLIRLSIGLEHVSDLKNDLSRGLTLITSSKG
ncbi:O-succinylhomoserine sulfhydrylase [Polynucleobacter sp. SHI8]|uniref:O-succinylhomoserine sulfhydrylase n=1 Tax=unclassified Polynucleobacter TaxID=2640945 RepID=UPI0024921F33|nr:MULTISPECIES: O-succinylhomoserine sulfhydrylase [unclassified Polynucleobacter]BDW11186.1 O-succinylhomoserine sulfhydrylase [Polynucleobacter sp. SHI2]BDW13632.1 O-succinylhomoserine sulfhydrylase [Polynucleobacter sp. SHI8]